MPTTRLAAIMFTDIVGYTAMMGQNRETGMAAVKLHEATLKDRIARHGGELLQTYGDGSLSIFESASAAVRCAWEIQEQLRDQVPLRIGLHIGEITRDGDHTFGDGVNIASRIESMGVAGAILFSKDLYKRIRNRPEFAVQSLGSFAFKNVEEPIEVFALANEGLEVPGPDKMMGKGERIDLSGSLKSNPNLPQFIGMTILGLVLVSLLSWGILSLVQNKKSSPIEQLEKSLVVLPFVNKSEEADTDFFSDGITEDILIQLSKLRGLKVISQSSAMRFKNSEESLQEIADQLGVNFVVQGSVRKQGNQIRISAQLIHAQEDANLWADQYDFELRDVFAIQSEVAQNIAKQLKSEISPQEQQGLDEQPTENTNAYQLYLRGRQMVRDRSLKSLQNAEVLFQEALKLDPDFAQAKAELANIFFLMALYGFGPDPFHKRQKAAELSREVLEENSKIVRAYDVLGSISMYTLQDFKQALLSFHKGLAEDPRDEDLLHHTAFLLCQLGKKEASLYTITKALEKDPFSPIIHAVYIRILVYHQQYEEAAEKLESAQKLFPNNELIFRERRWLYLFQKQCDELVDYFHKLPKSAANTLLSFACYCDQENVQEVRKYLLLDEVENWPYKELFLARAKRDITGMFAALRDLLPSTINRLLIDPSFEILREDPRFAAYLRKSAFGQVSDADVEAVMELIRE